MTFIADGKPLKVGFVPFGGENLASVRYRVTNVIEAMPAFGIDASIYDEDKKSTYDICVFQKKYGTKHQKLAAELQRLGCVVVLDMCDNHMLGSWLKRNDRRRRSKLLKMLRQVDHLSVSALALKDYLPHESAFLVEDLVDLGIPSPLSGASQFESFQPGDVVKLLWFGTKGKSTPQCGLYDLAARLPELNNTRCKVELTTLSNDPKLADELLSSSSFEVSNKSWSREAFEQAARVNHIALLPVSINPFTRGKTSNRLVTAFSSNLAVVGDTIPSYEPYKKYYRSGRLDEGIAHYSENPNSAVSDVEGAKLLVADLCSRQRLSSQWAETFFEIARVTS